MQKIKLDSVVKRFEDHLKIEDNNRIILSGKFGIGKTFFLKHFFDARSAEFNAIFIDPINYVVSSNEDIFELIKVDIIKQIYTSSEVTKKVKVSKAEKIALFASKKPQHFLKFITSSFKKINPFIEIVDNMYDGLAKLYSEYKDYEKKLEENYELTEVKIEEFADSFNSRTGSIFEDDFITKTIKTKLKKIRGERKNVLIIDDLDRIDPEHVFRILNILSAHNNSFGAKNKFEFDYIIIVCDNENIKNIFYHKYGSRVDYDGYIDKFYSTEIFKFENDDALKFYLESTFISQKDAPGFVELTLFILNSLIDADKITVRKIIKHRIRQEISSFVLYHQEGWKTNKPFELRRSILFVKNFNTFFVQSDDLGLLRLFRLLSLIYGDFNNFYEDLDDLEKMNTKLNSEGYSEMLSFLALQSHISKNSGDELFFDFVYGRNYREQDIVTEINVPEVRFMNMEYRIKLNYDSERPYDGTVSYFFNAKAMDSSTGQFSNKTTEQYFKKGNLFTELRHIIIECYNKGYLRKVDVVFRR